MHGDNGECDNVIYPVRSGSEQRLSDKVKQKFDSRTWCCV